jgi:hypothetical protein
MRMCGASSSSVLLSLAVLAAASTLVSPVPAAFGQDGAGSGLASAASRRAVRDLSFTPSDLRLWKDPETGAHFWFFTYEVVNNTGKDQRFAPRIEMLTDEGAVVRQGVDVPVRVSREIKEFIGDPLLEDQFEILGMVLQGEANARSGLVVFRVPALSDSEKHRAFHRSEREHLEHTELTVFVQGLSTETRKEPDAKSGGTVTLRKTVRLDYLVPGDPIAKGNVSYPVAERDDSTFR